MHHFVRLLEPRINQVNEFDLVLQAGLVRKQVRFQDRKKENTPKSSIEK